MWAGFQALSPWGVLEPHCPTGTEHELPEFAPRIVVNKPDRFQLHPCKPRPCLCLMLMFVILCLGLSINEYIITCLFVSMEWNK